MPGKMKEYLNGYISSLNNIQFQGNSHNYLLLQNFLYYMEVVGTIMFFVVVLCDTIMVVMMTRRLTRPLKILSRRAKEVTAGDLSVDIPVFRTGDEVESLSKAFDKMMGSIREYVEAQRVSMEKENEMRENELKTQTLLKDAQLKYLQSQINPHFLFNTLNAGMQLAIDRRCGIRRHFLSKIWQNFFVTICHVSMKMRHLRMKFSLSTIIFTFSMCVLPEIFIIRRKSSRDWKMFLCHP